MARIVLAWAIFPLLSQILGASEINQIPLVPAEGCDRERLGISCCSDGFSRGDNDNNGNELFIQESQYEAGGGYRQGCIQSCKKRQPTSIGVTVSLTNKYSNGDGKCWCEFKSARLDSTNQNYQTCLFDGHQNRFLVLPSSASRYLRPQTTVLKLKQDTSSWAWNDATVTDLEGNKWFDLLGPVISARNKKQLYDSNGTVIAGYQQKILSWHGTSYITIQDPEISGQVLVLASITMANSIQWDWEANVDIYLHQPAVSLASVSHSGLTPDIKVVGDIRDKTFDFMMDKNGSPTRLAQIVRNFQMFTFERNTYYLEISPNVDIAFITLCGFALDEMFNINYKRKRSNNLALKMLRKS